MIEASSLFSTHQTQSTRYWKGKFTTYPQRSESRTMHFICGQTSEVIPKNLHILRCLFDRPDANSRLTILTFALLLE